MTGWKVKDMQKIKLFSLITSMVIDGQIKSQRFETQ